MSPPSSSLKVTKSSHAIAKPGKLPTSIISSPSHSNRQKPVIIYTYSPKVIHTTADKFKSLVQKLTGHERTSPAPDLNENCCENPKYEDERLAAMANGSFCYAQLLSSTMKGSVASTDALGFDYSPALLYHDFTGLI